MPELLDALFAPLSQGFVLRALGAGTALGAVGALLGVFVVQRGLGRRYHCRGQLMGQIFAGTMATCARGDQERRTAV